MARKVETLLVDDLDGSPADETISFGLDGTTYEVDLSSDHGKALREDFAQWIEVARRSGAAVKRVQQRPRGESQAIREWAAANGWEIAGRGRIPANVVEAYKAA